MRVTTNTLAGPAQIAFEAPRITTYSQSMWIRSSGQVSVVVTGDGRVINAFPVNVR